VIGWPALKWFVLGCAMFLSYGSTALAGDWAEAAVARKTGGALGLPMLDHPSDNPPSAEKIRLGRKLFFDRRLSLNRTMSCGMCHIPEQGFGNYELQRAVGLEGRSLRRNAPSLVNVGYYKTLFVDGRETALETQFVSPLIAKNEMANPSIGYVVELVKSLPDYEKKFEAAFGGPATLQRIGQALAGYQRSLIAANSPFDQWKYGGDETALDESAKRGFALFSGKAGCSQCHLVGQEDAVFTDQSFHDTGYGWMREQERQNPPATQPLEVSPGVVFHMSRKQLDDVSGPVLPDLGRYEVTQDPADSWKFRTPSLRNIELTRPYMHDGGFARLEDVLAFYNGGGALHDQQSPLIQPLGLEKNDLADLEAFLKSLTSQDFATLVEEARVEAPDNW